MAKVDTSVLWGADSAEMLRLAFSSIQDALLDVGLVRDMSAPNQLDLSTVGTLPTPATVTNGSAIYCGFQNYKMAGSGDKPTIYFLVIYYMSSYSTQQSTSYRKPLIGITPGLGLGADGSISRGGGRRIATGFGTNPFGTPRAPVSRRLCVSSDAANYLTIVLDAENVAGLNVANDMPTPLCGVVERTVDPVTGQYTGVGFISAGTPGAYQSEGGFTFTNSVTGVATSSTFVPIQSGGNGWAGSGTGTSSFVFPTTVLSPEIQGCSLAILGYYKTDIAPGSTVPVTLYGTTRNYIAGGSAIGTGNIAAQYSHLLRFE